jgi:hypothetical protein
VTFTRRGRSSSAASASSARDASNGTARPNAAAPDARRCGGSVSRPVTSCPRSARPTRRSSSGARPFPRTATGSRQGPRRDRQGAGSAVEQDTRGEIERSCTKPSRRPRGHERRVGSSRAALAVGLAGQSELEATAAQFAPPAVPGGWRSSVRSCSCSKTSTGREPARLVTSSSSGTDVPLLVVPRRGRSPRRGRAGRRQAERDDLALARLEE